MTEEAQQAIYLTEQMQALLTAHGITCQIEKGWVLPYGRLPAIHAAWLPLENNGQLQIEVLIDDNTVIQEAFLGIGSGQEAIASAIQNFCANSFHVMLAAFWDVKQEPITIEQWQISNDSYTAFIGGFGVRNVSENDICFPPNLAGNIKAAIQSTLNPSTQSSAQNTQSPESQQSSVSESIEASMHWFHLFFCHISPDKDLVYDASHNNQPWSIGTSALASCQWQAQPSYYSVRQFLILKKNQE